MNNIVLILLVIALIKFILFGLILFVVFRQDIRSWFKQERTPLRYPICVYCQSAYTHEVGEPETRWDGDDLLLVTTYECQHCHFPTTHIERVPAAASKR